MKNFRRRTGLALATAAVTACSLLSPVAATAEETTGPDAAPSPSATATTDPESGAPADGGATGGNDTPGENGKPAGDPAPTNSPEPPAPSDNTSSATETLYEQNPELKKFCDNQDAYTDFPIVLNGKGKELKDKESAAGACRFGDQPAWLYPSQEFDKGLAIFNTVLAVLTAVAGVVGFIFKLNPNLINDIKGALKI